MHHVDAQEMWACTSCGYTGDVGMPIMWIYRRCRHAHHVDVQEMWACTSCEYTGDVGCVCMQEMWTCISTYAIFIMVVNYEDSLELQSQANEAKMET